MSKCHFRGSKIEFHIRVFLTRVILGPIWACMGVNILGKVGKLLFWGTSISTVAAFYCG